MKDLKLQYYLGGTSVATSPSGEITLHQFLYGDIPGLPKNIFSQIIHFATIDDKKSKNELKAQLPFILPAVTTDEARRTKDNIKDFTGIMALDFDGLEPGIAIELRQYLFEAFPFVFASWLSPSQRGVHAFVAIPVVRTTEAYKKLYYGLQSVHLEGIEGFDPAPKNPVLPLYPSPEPGMLIREPYRQHLWTYGKTPPGQDKIAVIHKTSGTGDYEQWTINNIKKAINNIIDRDGHGQVVRASRALGGRVGAGYIDRIKAENLIKTLIANNKYLKKDIAGYQKTAVTMIEYGMNEPLYF